MKTGVDSGILLNLDKVGSVKLTTTFEQAVSVTPILLLNELTFFRNNIINFLEKGNDAYE